MDPCSLTRGLTYAAIRRRKNMNVKGRGKSHSPDSMTDGYNGLSGPGIWFLLRFMQAKDESQIRCVGQASGLDAFVLEQPPHPRPC